MDKPHHTSSTNSGRKDRWDDREAMRFFRISKNSDSSFREYATNAILEEQKQIHTVTCKSEIENH